MSTFGDELVQSLREALAYAKGEGPAIVHPDVSPREVREAINLTQAQMAPLVGMSLSGYRKWEQGTRRVSGPCGGAAPGHPQGTRCGAARPSPRVEAA